MVSKYLLFWEKVVEVSCRHLSQNGLALIFCFPTQLDILFSASKNNFLANFYFPHGFFCIIFLNWDWKYPIFWYPTPHGQWALKWDSRVHAAQTLQWAGAMQRAGALQWVRVLKMHQAKPGTPASFLTKLNA